MLHVTPTNPLITGDNLNTELQYVFLLKPLKGQSFPSQVGERTDSWQPELWSSTSPTQHLKFPVLFLTPPKSYVSLSMKYSKLTKVFNLLPLQEVISSPYHQSNMRDKQWLRFSSNSREPLHQTRVSCERSNRVTEPSPQPVPASEVFLAQFKLHHRAWQVTTYLPVEADQTCPQTPSPFWGGCVPSELPHSLLQSEVWDSQASGTKSKEWKFIISSNLL